jgi:hypothetical protein
MSEVLDGADLGIGGHETLDQLGQFFFQSEIGCHGNYSPPRVIGARPTTGTAKGNANRGETRGLACPVRPDNNSGGYNSNDGRARPSAKRASGIPPLPAAAPEIRSATTGKIEPLAILFGPPAGRIH